MSTPEPIIKFSNEESKAAIRSKLAQNLSNLIELTRSAIKSSESQDLFKSCIKSFAANDSLIDQSCDKFKKIEIISSQLNCQVSQLKEDLEVLNEVCRQIDSVQKKREHYGRSSVDCQ